MTYRQLETKIFKNDTGGDSIFMRFEFDSLPCSCPTCEIMSRPDFAWEGEEWND